MVSDPEKEALRRRIAELESANARLRSASGAAAELAASQAAQASETQFRLVVESATEYAIFTMDHARRVTSWNTGAQRVLGWSEEEILGQSADVIFTPEDQAAGEPVREARIAVENGRAEDVRWHLRRDGSRLWATGVMLPLRDDAGAVQGLLKILRDKTAEKHAADELRESSQFLRQVLQSSADRITVLDLEGRVLFMGPGSLAALEIDSFEAVQGRSWLDLWPPETRETAQGALEAAQGGQTGRFQALAFTFKGNPRWWDAQVTAMPGADGQPERLLAISRDLSEQKQAEERVRESEGELRQIADALPELVAHVDAAHRYRFVNRAYEEWFGRPVDSIVGQHVRDVIGEVAYAVRRDLLERAAVGEHIAYDTWLPYGRGGRKEAAIQYLPRRREDGTVAGYYVLAVDISARKQLERQLLRVNETLEQRVAERTADRDRMWRLSTDIMLVADYDGIIRAVNPAWSNLLGWSEVELVGRSFLDLVHPEDLAATQAEVGHLTEGLQTQHFENRYRHKNGSYVILSWAAVPEDGRIHAVGRDVTREREQAEMLQQAEEALRQSQKMEAIGQLTGGLAHDFNNLLTGILGSLELLRIRLDRGRLEDLGRYVTAAEGAANRAAALTHRLLAFSRRQTLDPKPTDANRLVAGMLELIQRTVGPGITAETKLPDDLWLTLCDPHQLENALLNLCINARDAMPEGGRLVLETTNTWVDERAAREREIAPGPYVAISVTDTGIGMTPEVAARAFDPFFTTKPIGMGTGLGLSMIYGFAKQSGGKVRIYSRPGQGTTVRIYLPRYDGALEDEALVSASAPPSRAEGGGTVLVVEDEQTVRMLVTELLTEMGYTLLEAAEGISALKVLQSAAPIDLLITDVGLPGGMNGRQLADAARQLRPKLPVLFITGYAESRIFGSASLEPGMQVLAKPFSADALANAVESATGNQ